MAPTAPLALIAVLALTDAFAARAQMQAKQSTPLAEHFYALDPQRGTYDFGYDTGSLQHQSFRQETRSEDGAVRGAYGYVEAGVLRVTEYSADRAGYRCRQIVRYLVHPERGVFVSDDVKTSSAERNLVLSTGFGDAWEARSGRHRERGFLDGREARPARPAQPARVLGRKEAGRYKGVTAEPAEGGTGAVSAWNSAHAADLRDEEVLRGHAGPASHAGPGGAPVWPVTEDGRRVVWQPFRSH